MNFRQRQEFEGIYALVYCPYDPIRSILYSLVSCTFQGEDKHEKMKRTTHKKEVKSAGKQQFKYPWIKMGGNC